MKGECTISRRAEVDVELIVVSATLVDVELLCENKEKTQGVLNRSCSLYRVG